MNDKPKSASELLKEQLFRTPPKANNDLFTQADVYCEEYAAFLDAAKIEREAVREGIRLAKANGFTEFVPDTPLKAGDKVYLNHRNKALILAVIGTRSLSDGVSIAAAHIDSPRLDLKPMPLYEDNQLAYFDTHYYGGVKKYQWAAIPLALHGVVMRKDGTSVEVKIGEDASDPVFCVTDLLPHLAQEQMKRPASQIIRGEDLNVLIGSRPFKDDTSSESVKLNIMNILFEKYGVIESDFISAELEIVPAFKACDVGFDRSMLGAYGHDDRVCAYPALTAIMEQTAPAYTAITVFADKEETGSDGTTGMQSTFMKDFIHDLALASNVPLHRVLANSLCLSADVNAAFDPIYPEVMEKNNCCYLNRGVVITKYTGSHGKGGTSDASAETMSTVRCMLDEANVVWQIGELGRVDAGGGGTVAKYIANLNIETVDLGVPVLSMHAPFEVVSKFDVFMAHKAFLALFNRQ